MNDDPPPILGSWRNLYVLVIANLALTVLVLWLVTRAYS
jgi:hypothetical protein